MAYSYSQKITVNSATYGGTANSTNFPLLFGGLAGPYTALKTTAHGGYIQNTVTFNGQTVPADLIFTTDSGGTSLLNWEVASYNASTGDIEVWIKIPTLTYNANIVIYMFAGNASVSTYQGGSVGAAYDSTFEMVMHFANGSSLSVLDSTGNANNGSASGGMSATSGEIDGAAFFNNGLSGYVSVAGSASLDNWTYQTISVWMKAAANAQTAYGRLIEKGSNNEWALIFNSGAPNAVNVQLIGTTTPSSVSSATVCDGTWHKIDVLLDNTVGGISIFTDGAFTSGIATGTIGSSFVNSINIGQYGGTGYYYSGSMDDVHISNVLRSTSWITATYNNQSSPTTFYTLSSNPLTSKVRLLGLLGVGI